MALRRAFLQKVSSSPYGPELITNGTFDSDASGWSGFTGSATIVYDSGKGKVTGNGGAGQNISIVSGKTYKISVDITKIGGLSLVYSVSVGSASTNGSYYNSGAKSIEGTPFEDTFVASGTNAAAFFTFYIYGSSNPFNIDNVSIKEVL